MKIDKVKPDGETYNTLMKAQVRTISGAVLKRMKIDKVRPDVKTATTLMNAYGTNHIEAEKVLTRMKIDKVKPDIYVHDFMNAYGSNHVEAEKVLKRMKIDKVRPTLQRTPLWWTRTVRTIWSGEGVDTHEDW